MAKDQTFSGFCFVQPSLRGRLLKVTCLDCREHSHVENDEKKHWEEAEKHEPKAKMIARSEKKKHSCENLTLKLWINLVGGSV